MLYIPLKKRETELRNYMSKTTTTASLVPKINSEKATEVPLPNIKEILTHPEDPPLKKRAIDTNISLGLYPRTIHSNAENPAGKLLMKRPFEHNLTGMTLAPILINPGSSKPLLVNTAPLFGMPPLKNPMIGTNRRVGVPAILRRPKINIQPHPSGNPPSETKPASQAPKIPRVILDKDSKQNLEQFKKVFDYILLKRTESKIDSILITVPDYPQQLGRSEMLPTLVQDQMMHLIVAAKIPCNITISIESDNIIPMPTVCNFTIDAGRYKKSNILTEASIPIAEGAKGAILRRKNDPIIVKRRFFAQALSKRYKNVRSSFRLRVVANALEGTRLGSFLSTPFYVVSKITVK